MVLDYCAGAEGGALDSLMGLIACGALADKSGVSNMTSQSAHELPGRLFYRLGWTRIADTANRYVGSGDLG